MKIENAQAQIEEFDKARGWEDNWNLKDLGLNIVEEVSELWNLIKWIGEEEQREVIEGEKTEVSDFIGDVLFLILKMANRTGVDAETALKDTLKEYRERMPSEKMKESGHANINAGGTDDKE
jgi:NTP pyrophosphatase (non-canonical NTP hydrolase)